MVLKPKMWIDHLRGGEAYAAVVLSDKWAFWGKHGVIKYIFMSRCVIPSEASDHAAGRCFPPGVDMSHSPSSSTVDDIQARCRQTL